MNKLYFIIFFIGFGFSARSQAVKPNEPNFPSEALTAKVLRFYPNPATTIINFELLKPAPVQRDYILQVYNFVGKKVYEQSTVVQKTTIPLNDFFRGVYIYQLRDKSGRIIESGKFQVTK